MTFEIQWCYLIFYMTATTHALVGAAIITKFPNPWGLFFAFLSHFPLDYIPHWDTITNGRKHSKIFNFSVTAVDVLLGFILVWYFFERLASPVILFSAVILSQLPDWIGAPYYFFNINFYPSRIIFQFQKKFHHKLKLPLGLITQIITLLFVFMLLGIIPT